MKNNKQRRKYKWAKLQDYEGERLHCDYVTCSDLKSEKKEGRFGNMYNSNLFRVNLYCDQPRLNFSWFIQLFNDIRHNGTIVIRPNSDLFSIFSHLDKDDYYNCGCFSIPHEKDDNNPNYYVDDFTVLQILLNEINSADFRVRKIKTNSGYVKYIPQFIGDIKIANPL